MSEHIQLTTTTESEELAQAIAVRLVDERLAACVQVLGPISSTYRWQEKIETTQEWLCLVKSRHDLADRIETIIKEMHPYEVPEIIVIPILSGSADYLHWLREQLLPPG